MLNRSVFLHRLCIDQKLFYLNLGPGYLVHQHSKFNCICTFCCSLEAVLRSRSDQDLAHHWIGEVGEQYHFMYIYVFILIANTLSYANSDNNHKR